MAVALKRPAAQELADQWSDVGHLIGIPLDINECFDRNVARTVVEYVDQIKADNSEISVDVVMVPYQLQRSDGRHGNDQLITIATATETRAPTPSTR
jgi:hypothetical protein